MLVENFLILSKKKKNPFAVDKHYLDVPDQITAKKN